MRLPFDFPVFAIQTPNPCCKPDHNCGDILVVKEDGRTSLALFTDESLALSMAQSPGAKARRFDDWPTLRKFIEHAGDCHCCTGVELDCDVDQAAATAEIGDLLQEA